MKRFAVGYEFLCRIVMMVVVANVAFLVHTLLGLVVVGFFPSIAATYATFRTWLLDVDDRSWSISRTWRTFHQAWLEELGPANKFGWPQFLIWALLIWEYWFVQNNDLGTTGFAVSGALLLLNVLYGLFVFVSWGIHVNFAEKLTWVVKTSLSMVIARPLCSLMIALLFLIVVWAYYTWPGLMIAFGIAVPVFAAMMAIYSCVCLAWMCMCSSQCLSMTCRKKQMPIRVLEVFLCSIAWGYSGEWFYDVLLVSNA